MLSASTSGITSDAGIIPAEKSRRTLLIVDDEEGPRQSLRVVFKEEYNLLLASNGPEALALASNHAINAAVLDIRMTGMSGTELLEKLKVVQPSIEVIMLTAYDYRDDFSVWVSDAYVVKSSDLSNLKATIKQLIKKTTA